jgi:hypothetical protein
MPLLSALLTAGCATSAVLARKPSYRHVDGRLKEVSLFTDAESNRWVAVVKCDHRTPERIRALATNDGIVLNYHTGTPPEHIVFYIINGQKYDRTPFASCSAGSSPYNEWSMYTGCGSTWRVDGAVTSAIPCERVLVIPDPTIRYDKFVLGTRLVFYGEQTVLLPLAVCADVVTFPFQVVLYMIGGRIQAAMWP